MILDVSATGNCKMVEGDAVEGEGSSSGFFLLFRPWEEMVSCSFHIANKNLIFVMNF